MFSVSIFLLRCLTAQQGSGHTLTELIEARVALMLEASHCAALFGTLLGALEGRLYLKGHGT